MGQSPRFIILQYYQWEFGIGSESRIGNLFSKNQNRN